MGWMKLEKKSLSGILNKPKKSPVPEKKNSISQPKPWHTINRAPLSGVWVERNTPTVIITPVPTVFFNWPLAIWAFQVAVPTSFVAMIMSKVLLT